MEIKKNEHNCQIIIKDKRCRVIIKYEKEAPKTKQKIMYIIKAARNNKSLGPDEVPVE